MDKIIQFVDIARRLQSIDWRQAALLDNDKWQLLRACDEETCVTGAIRGK